MPSPACTVQDGASAPIDPTPLGADVTPGNTVTIQLVDLASGAWSLTLVGQDDSVTPPTLTTDLVNKRATFTAPAAPWALIFESTVQQGVDLDGAARPDYTTRIGIYTVDGSGQRLMASNERAEGNALFGWITKVNALVQRSGSQISVKSYGAKGDGTTDDSAAFQAAVTALAGTGVALYVPAGTYLANFTIDKADMVIVGQGATSIIKSATNAPAISIRADQGATRTILRDFKVLGTGAGASQVGIANGVSATLASGDGRALIDRIIVEGTGSDGIQIFNQDTTNVGLHIGTRILAPRIESCGAGASGYAINVGALAEYVMVDTPSLYSNQRGIGIFAGNFCGGGPGTIVTTTEYAIEIGPASNDAHGIIAGWNINHNGHALYAYGITLGFDFVGCHFYDNTDIILGDSGGGGCVGVRFIGGAIDVSNIYFRGSTGTRFLGVAWPGSNANTMYPNLTYPSTQYFDPSNLDLAGNAPAFIAAGVVGWTPAPGKSAVSFASDANHTASAAEYTHTFLQVTSGVSLTGTRDLVLPISAGAQWTVYNGTTGAQSIQVIGATGTGITIANGKRAILESDGTNMQRVTADT